MAKKDPIKELEKELKDSEDHLSQLNEAIANEEKKSVKERNIQLLKELNEEINKVKEKNADINKKLQVLLGENPDSNPLQVTDSNHQPKDLYFPESFYSPLMRKAYKAGYYRTTSEMEFNSIKKFSLEVNGKKQSFIIK